LSDGDAQEREMAEHTIYIVDLDDCT